MKILKIYTDGGCSNNQADVNFGGYGTILEFGNHIKEIYGGEANTTNNRMELTAVIQGFKALTKENQTIHVYTDSAYVADCFRKKWYIKWKKNNWMRTPSEAVLNQDLWQELIALTEKHNVEFFRVKGHIDLNSSAQSLFSVYKKFLEWNGSHYSYEDFEYITKMNNRADILANIGIDECKTGTLQTQNY